MAIWRLKHHSAYASSMCKPAFCNLYPVTFLPRTAVKAYGVFAGYRTAVRGLLRLSKCDARAAAWCAFLYLLRPGGAGLMRAVLLAAPAYKVRAWVRNARPPLVQRLQFC
jgi:hypothetical protein